MMTGFHLFMFLVGGFVFMLGLHNSIQLSNYPAGPKLKQHRTYQEFYAAAGLMVILGIALMCAALRALVPF